MSQGDASAANQVGRILLTVDAVGGVWTYAMELARALHSFGISTVFAGFGPAPSAGQRAEAEQAGILEWPGLPLDWLAAEPEELKGVGPAIEAIARRHGCSLLHLNLPSQAASLSIDLPVIAVSHSCLPSWWKTMRDTPLPACWGWHARLNAEGFARADLVIVPSRSHGEAVARAYEQVPNLIVVPNALAANIAAAAKEPFVFAAGRWWDEGKNGAVLEQAALHIPWPLKLAGSLHGPGGQQFIARHAEALGPLAHTRLLQALRHAEILVSPSLYEPFGLVALEGARAGCALILSDIPTYRELWEGAALFFPPHHADRLVRQIERLIEDVDLRREMGAKALARSWQFTPERQATRMTELYSGLLKGRQVEHGVVA